jgi:hypothetical protein
MNHHENMHDMAYQAKGGRWEDAAYAAQKSEQPRVSQGGVNLAVKALGREQRQEDDGGSTRTGVLGSKNFMDADIHMGDPAFSFSVSDARIGNDDGDTVARRRLVASKKLLVGAWLNGMPFPLKTGAPGEVMLNVDDPNGITMAQAYWIAAQHIKFAGGSLGHIPGSRDARVKGPGDFPSRLVDMTIQVRGTINIVNSGDERLNQNDTVCYDFVQLLKDANSTLGPAGTPGSRVAFGGAKRVVPKLVRVPTGRMRANQDVLAAADEVNFEIIKYIAYTATTAAGLVAGGDNRAAVATWLAENPAGPAEPHAAVGSKLNLLILALPDITTQPNTRAAFFADLVSIGTANARLQLARNKAFALSLYVPIGTVGESGAPGHNITLNVNLQ